MFAASRRIYLYWLLLLVPALAVGTGALLLLRREQARLDERGAEALKARQETTAARARLTVETIELLIGEVETGLLDTLAAEPAEGLDVFLDRWERENPLVRTTFLSAADSRVVRPDQRTANDEGRGLLRRFARQFGARPPWTVLAPAPKLSVTVEPPKNQPVDPMPVNSKDSSSIVVQALPAPREAEPILKQADAPLLRQVAEQELRKEIDQNVAQAQQARRDVQQLVKTPNYSNAAGNNIQTASNSFAPSSSARFAPVTPASPPGGAQEGRQAEKATADSRRRASSSSGAAPPPASREAPKLADQREPAISTTDRGQATVPAGVAKDRAVVLPKALAADEKKSEAQPLAAASVVTPRVDDVPAIPSGAGFTVERRGWVPASLDGRLRLAGWVQLAGSGEVRGVEIDLPSLVSRLAGTLPAGIGSDEGYALRDDQGRTQHLVGRVPAGAPPASRVPLAAALLPGWEVVSYLTLSSAAYASDPGSFWLNAVLVGIFVAAILVGGSLLLWQARRSEAEAAQKTSFVANVSHEFKTPLTTIRLYSELLEQGRVRDEAQGAVYLRTIGRETQRLARLVNNALDFSRLEQGQKKFAREALDLTAELGRLLDTHTPRVAEAGLKLNRDLPASALRATTDRDAFEQIVLNLIDNACKYADGGGVVLVSLAARAGGGAEVRVSDRGPGVPAEHRERIFEKFHRVDDALTAEKSGAGLGLSIARQLARGLGGDLRYAPREGGGAEFIFSLP